ncbi:MAG: dihydroorotate dehydrogenase electron transfer subunit [Bacillota bacterium]
MRASRATPGGAPGTPDPRYRAEWVQVEARVVAHRPGGPDWYKLVLEAPAIAARARAGQFVELAVQPSGRRGLVLDPLLKRPFSLCEIRPGDGTVSLIYRAVGRGTRLLAQVPPGERLEVLGPLGHSFPDPARGEGLLVLVGGGIGIPPMAAAAAWAAAAGRPVRAIAAARSREGLAALDELAATGAAVTVCTDDGSAGRQGLATDPLAEWLRAGAVAEVWACGPEAMLRGVRDLCLAAGVPAWLSLERPMACGFGVCMTCTVPRADGKGYFKCCTDGPVFRAEEVRLG